MGLKISKNTPFWAILGQLMQLIPEEPDSDPVSGVYVVNDRYVHLPGYQFIIKEPRLAVFTG